MPTKPSRPLVLHRTPRASTTSPSQAAWSTVIGESLSRPRAERVDRRMYQARASSEVNHLRNPVHDDNPGWPGCPDNNAVRQAPAQMPLLPSGPQSVRALPLTLPVVPAVAVNFKASPQDVWWRVEDLLARLALHCGITVERDGREARPTVMVHNLRLQVQADIAELRNVALDAENYRCWRDGRPLNLVQVLEWNEDDLMLVFTPLTILERWDDGSDLAEQVRGFLARLERWPRKVSL